ncbi:MAG TPA: glycosyltransferase [Gemmatimonadaceae bacterium]
MAGPPNRDTDATTNLVIPCYNEADRLVPADFTSFVQATPNVSLTFVNDGSGDRTLDVLRDIASACPNRMQVLDLEHNSGKAEAVRRGMLHALTTKADFVGFWDADLATPLGASSAFIELLRERPVLDMVIGSRVRLLGRTIERRPARHYAGRVFATAASLTLRLPVYDTQCGAKLFRASPRLARVLETPFVSSWLFDVEMIARFGSLSAGYAPESLHGRIHELPLLEWRHMAGSKVRLRHFARAMVDLARIYQVYIRNGNGRH